MPSPRLRRGSTSPLSSSPAEGRGLRNRLSHAAEIPAKHSRPPQEQASSNVHSLVNTPEPLPRGGSKNQEPASGGTTGVYISESESKKTEAPADRPTLRDVKPEDLRDPARLLDLHTQAVDAGYVPPSEASRLNFFAAANHARVIGSRNPPGLFVRILRSGLWSFLTQDDEDVARVQLRRVLYPEGASVELPRGEAPRPSPGISADARFVRDVTDQLRQRGIPESSIWRLVNRERPEWTRERWDAALAELRGEVRPCRRVGAELRAQRDKIPRIAGAAFVTQSEQPAPRKPPRGMAPCVLTRCHSSTQTEVAEHTRLLRQDGTKVADCLVGR